MLRSRTDRMPDRTPPIGAARGSGPLLRLRVALDGGGVRVVDPIVACHPERSIGARQAHLRLRGRAERLGRAARSATRRERRPDHGWPTQCQRLRATIHIDDRR